MELDEKQQKLLTKTVTALAVALLQPLAVRRALHKLGHDYTYSEIYAAATIISYVSRTWHASEHNLIKELKELADLAEAVANG